MQRVTILCVYYEKWKKTKSPTNLSQTSLFLQSSADKRWKVDLYYNTFIILRNYRDVMLE